MIIDRLLQERAEQGRPIRVGMIGAGFMGRGVANQITHSVNGMELVAIANRSVDRAAAAFAYAGVENTVTVSTQDGLDQAIASGRPAVTDDPFLLIRSPGIDCLIDVTGAVEFGAQISVAAIGNGKHLVSMNAELDATVGPLLKRKADAAGVIFTGSDGDQPGVQMNLFRFVKSIGLTPLLCGNVKGLQDRFRNPTTQAEFAAKWGQNPYMVTSFADGTKISFEQAIVANATGMSILQRGMTGRDHLGHVDELTGMFDVEALRAVGGAVDYVVGSKPGPGVFVLATHDDPKQQHYLNLYKLGTGPLYSFYTPYHLCHFEVPLSVARAVLVKDSVIQALSGPKVEVITTAKRALSAGETIDELGGYMTYGQCERYDVAARQRLLPMGQAAGCRLKRFFAVDEPIGIDDVEFPQGRTIDRLRKEQDAIFAPAEKAPAAVS
ncbi:MAG: NAD(P)-dependent oxidoreductase [Alphaproteobacteria bacterium]|nr:NAD(P)-dependent oxidoreductase [Alphaproteobacteria bacterium]